MIPITRRMDPEIFEALNRTITEAHLLKTHEAVYFAEPAPVLFRPGDGNFTRLDTEYPVRLPPNPRFTL